MSELRNKIIKEIPELKKCFQCGTCVSSCPAKIYSGHFSPREFILECLRGMQSAVLNDNLYRCITCNNCNERCPQDVNPYEVVVKLKNIAVREKLLSEEKLKQVMEEYDHLLETGIAYPVTDLTRKKREELDLTPIDEKKGGFMKYAFFVGCTTRVKLPFVEKLAREIFRKMDVELVDLEFTCCPTARIAKDVSIDTWLHIAARNLALAEKEELPMISMCTGCTQTLREAQEMLKSTDTRKSVNDTLAKVGLEYKGTSEVKFYAQLIHEYMENIKLERKLDLMIASHPGCHILRPSNIIGFDDPENPTKLDDLIRFLGADAADYPNKAFCCGFPLYSLDPEAAGNMMRDKITTIKADCLTVLCPTCFEYYELRQRAIAQQMGFKPLQVVHYMQLLGLCMGLEPHFDQLKFKDEDFLRKL